MTLIWFSSIFMLCSQNMINYFVFSGSDEQRFLEASMAYVSGNPILSDEEYDKLKMKLKVCISLI